MQRGGVIGGGHHDDGVLHRAVLLERSHCARHGGFFLTNGNVDAGAILAFLIDNGVNGNRSFAGLPVANN